MNTDQLESLIENAVTAALISHRELYEQKLQDFLFREERFDCSLIKEDDHNVLFPSHRPKCLKSNKVLQGLSISNSGFSPLMDNIQNIFHSPQPTNLHQLTIFLGRIGLYCRFIKNYALCANPLTKILKAKEVDKVNSFDAKQMKICLDVEQLESFNKLRIILSSGDLTQAHPDYEEPFQLTTYCTSLTIGATLSQNGKAIYFISRTTKHPEYDYSKNQLDLIAIIWAFKKLANILNNAHTINIYSNYDTSLYEHFCHSINLQLQQLNSIIRRQNINIFSDSSHQSLVKDTSTKTALVSHMEEQNYLSHIGKNLPGEGCVHLKFKYNNAKLDKDNQIISLPLITDINRQMSSSYEVKQANLSQIRIERYRKVYIHNQHYFL